MYRKLVHRKLIHRKLIHRKLLPQKQMLHRSRSNFDKDSDTNSSTDAGNSSYDGDDEYYTEFPKMLSNQMDARIPPKND